MERGKIAADERPAVMFVFEDLIAEIVRPRQERLMVAARQWDRALACWRFSYDVCDRMRDLIDRFGQQIEVVTWHSMEFAQLIHEELHNRQVFVARVQGGMTYEELSPFIATDRDVVGVYDPDPRHRHGYGFKGRDYWMEFG